MSDEIDKPDEKPVDKPWLFKKGVVQNPTGRPPLTPEEKELSALTRPRYNRTVNRIFKLGVDGMKKMLEEVDKPDCQHNVLDILIARQLHYCMKNGDPGKFEAILGRMIGIPARSVYVSGEDGGPIDAIITKMTAEERDAEIKRLDKLDEELGDE